MRRGIGFVALLLFLTTVGSSFVGASSVAAATTGTVKIISSVNFRTGPSTSSSSIRFLKKSESATLVEKTNAYWLKVKDLNGVVGYVSTSSKYVQVTYPSGSSSSTTKPAPKPAPKPTPVPTPAPSPTPTTSQQVEAVIAAGMRYLGTPYEYGSNRNTTATFDCSDFVRQAFKDALKIVLPASSKSQGTFVRSNSAVQTDWHSLKRGDLMFFMSYKGTSASLYKNKQPLKETITHVGIYLGNGQVLHTYSKASGGVRVDNISGKHWEYRFLYGGSAL
ncbi:MAG: SH3 domain-containing C40 family peptidase [Candidatus Cohnella colombiensis]|uniref:SH3 domain-containing C40 family peptidase n=1 Tax=Candidatus Cohnella colombiensis TaxID=3121368 RepID=A0AA95EXJ2_9BACL|nr:MAG: SH3 domain-containing C40 family peptidase [Cohnella sp.]